MMTLRTFTDKDTILFKKWLSNDHVKMWFERPEIDLFLEDWLNEVAKRDKEYSWINYFIVELNNLPIGFAMYYDCWDAKEVWYTIENKSECFSMDYLIGEPHLIGKGYGKALIRLLITEIKKNTSIKSIIVQPHFDNHSSCGVLISTGFTFDTEKKYFILNT